jgi:hypothetical protein
LILVIALIAVKTFGQISSEQVELVDPFLEQTIGWISYRGCCPSIVLRAFIPFGKPENCSWRIGKVRRRSEANSVRRR